MIEQCSVLFQEIRGRLAQFQQVFEAKDSGRRDAIYVWLADEKGFVFPETLQLISQNRMCFRCSAFRQSLQKIRRFSRSSFVTSFQQKWKGFLSGQKPHHRQSNT